MAVIRVLWIVQDGVLAGPGASQVRPYLRGLVAEGVAPVLMSFEKERFLSDRARMRRVRDELAAAKVPWTALPFGGGSAAPRTIAQLFRAVGCGRGLVRRHRIDLVHARSYIPALMGLALGRPLVFDMRGLWPRERVDGGLWKEDGLVFRAGNLLEGLLLRRAAGIVLLAEGAREHLPEIRQPVRVIPTAVDLDRFRPGLPPPEGAEELIDRELFVLSGALGTWYLLDEMLDLLSLAIRQSERAHVLILTEEDPRSAVEGLRARGVPAERVTVRGVPHDEVPRWYSLAAAGIFLIQSAPSKRASAPTKLGEFLACGVPVITTPGIGDTEALVAETRTGVVVRDLSRDGYREALAELAALRSEGPALVRRCREAARSRLDLASAVRGYAGLYRELGA